MPLQPCSPKPQSRVRPHTQVPLSNLKLHRTSSSLSASSLSASSLSASSSSSSSSLSASSSSFALAAAADFWRSYVRATEPAFRGGREAKERETGRWQRTEKGGEESEDADKGEEERTEERQAAFLCGARAWEIRSSSHAEETWRGKGTDEKVQDSRREADLEEKQTTETKAHRRRASSMNICSQNGFHPDRERSLEAPGEEGEEEERGEDEKGERTEGGGTKERGDGGKYDIVEGEEEMKGEENLKEGRGMAEREEDGRGELLEEELKEEGEGSGVEEKEDEGTCREREDETEESAERGSFGDTSTLAACPFSPVKADAPFSKRFSRLFFCGSSPGRVEEEFSSSLHMNSPGEEKSAGGGISSSSLVSPLSSFISSSSLSSSSSVSSCSSSLSSSSSSSSLSSSSSSSSLSSSSSSSLSSSFSSSLSSSSSSSSLSSSSSSSSLSSSSSSSSLSSSSSSSSLSSSSSSSSLSSSSSVSSCSSSLSSSSSSSSLSSSSSSSSLSSSSSSSSLSSSSSSSSLSSSSSSVSSSSSFSCSSSLSFPCPSAHAVSALPCSSPGAAAAKRPSVVILLSLPCQSASPPLSSLSSLSSLAPCFARLPRESSRLRVLLSSLSSSPVFNSLASRLESEPRRRELSGNSAGEEEDESEREGEEEDEETEASRASSQSGVGQLPPPLAALLLSLKLSSAFSPVYRQSLHSLPVSEVQAWKAGEATLCSGTASPAGRRRSAGDRDSRSSLRKKQRTGARGIAEGMGEGGAREEESAGRREEEEKATETEVSSTLRKKVRKKDIFHPYLFVLVGCAVSGDAAAALHLLRAISLMEKMRRENAEKEQMATRERTGDAADERHRGEEHAEIWEASNMTSRLDGDKQNGEEQKKEAEEKGEKVTSSEKRSDLSFSIDISEVILACNAAIASVLLLSPGGYRDLCSLENSGEKQEEASQVGITMFEEFCLRPLLLLLQSPSALAHFLQLTLSTLTKAQTVRHSTAISSSSLSSSLSSSSVCCGQKGEGDVLGGRGPGDREAEETAGERWREAAQDVLRVRLSACKLPFFTRKATPVQGEKEQETSPSFSVSSLSELFSWATVEASKERVIVPSLLVSRRGTVGLWLLVAAALYIFHRTKRKTTTCSGRSFEFCSCEKGSSSASLLPLLRRPSSSPRDSPVSSFSSAASLLSRLLASSFQSPAERPRFAVSQQDPRRSPVRPCLSCVSSFFLFLLLSAEDARHRLRTRANFSLSPPLSLRKLPRRRWSPTHPAGTCPTSRDAQRSREARKEPTAETDEERSMEDGSENNLFGCDDIRRVVQFMMQLFTKPCRARRS
ncbi:hypothetical protein TGME49_300160 [Toxoplasma gondii ME49]|uniref:Uncharacterized protein n=1 Tax=Toxoplasma gondii (strain ATCC 50611 / Me49) TaxID=508771 RepID=S8EQ35_TOXGM|nr:hypothetical protein TGME49_300160 [Toxoplasma gondii ME49]EPT25461.1 hypothetical protein TGME49_300160 [Toxoplasma gondii ME49]|eukprot:XP_018635194.1 hypothetical protein TGME49_300160 [Toxoplasma gondii ME49]